MEPKRTFEGHNLSYSLATKQFRIPVTRSSSFPNFDTLWYRIWTHDKLSLPNLLFCLFWRVWVCKFAVYNILICSPEKPVKVGSNYIYELINIITYYYWTVYTKCSSQGWRSVGQKLVKSGFSYLTKAFQISCIFNDRNSR